MNGDGRRDETMRNRNLAVSLFGLLTFGALLISAAKPQAGAAVSGQAKSPSNLGGQMPASFDQDVARVVADVDRIEADTLSQMDRTTLDRQGQVRTLGKLLLFDKRLSVNQKRSVQFLPYAGDRIHRADSIFEPDYRVVSGIRENALQ